VISSSRWRASAWAAPFVAAGACALAGCPTTAATVTFPPITGIIIQSAPLVSGFGCGTGTTQVFRYVAVVNYTANPDAAADAAVPVGEGSPWTNGFECFTDAVFENLPALNGSLDFTVSIFAFDMASYAEAGLPPNLGCPPGAPVDGGPCALGNFPITPAQESKASWTTTCLATEQVGVPVLAVCDPLTSPLAPLREDAGITDASAPDTSADGEAGPAEPPVEASASSNDG
jgi:hypothetical protein